MKMKKYCNFLLAMFVLSAMINPPKYAYAQMDENEEDDFSLPPPPPPPTGALNNNRAAISNTPSGDDTGSAFGSPRGSKTNSAKADAGGGVLSQSQKQKFAKAPIEDITDENYPEIIDSFDFPNAELTDIVKAISELTGKNFIVDPGVRGKITIIAPSKITVAQAYKAFLSALAINGWAVVPSGGFLKIRSATNAKKDSIETYTGNYFPNSDQMITRIVHLKHISSEALVRDLRNLTSSNGELQQYTATNSLIISDYGSSVERIMKIINQLDVPGFEDQLEVLPVKYAKAKDLADLVDKIVNKGDKSKTANGGFSAGIPRFTTATPSRNGAQGGPYFMVFPDDRSNSLIVVGNKEGIQKIKKLLAQLDFKIRAEDAGGVYVYYVKNGDAEKIAQTLSGIAKDSAPKPAAGASGAPTPFISPVNGVQAATQDLFGGDVKVTADKGTNSIIIVASKQDYEIVIGLLNKLDIARDQVYVEAIIMEMSSQDNLDWQIGYLKFDSSGGKSGFNGFSGNTLADLLSPAGTSQGTILGFGSGDTVTITPPLGTPGTSTTGTTTTAAPITIASLIGFVKFLKQITNVNILSTPQIVALDNQEASIEVGDKVVTGTQQSTPGNGGAIVVTPQFEDATIALKIKPTISPESNTVRMDIDSSVKQLSAISSPKALTDQVQPLATRKLKTSVSVNNNDTIVLGGLIKDVDTVNVTKVPLLGDIPIIGWLFKSRSVAKSKTNLLTFLTPTIIRSRADSSKILGKKLDDRLNFIKASGGRDPFGEKIDEITHTKKQ